MKDNLEQKNIDPEECEHTNVSTDETCFNCGASSGWCNDCDEMVGECGGSYELI